MSLRFMLSWLSLTSLSDCRRHQEGLRAPPPSGRDLPGEKWFTQRLDHFKITDQASWRQRYWINWRHYRPGGPTLLMVGGEGEANPQWLEAGSWLDYAQAEGAAMVLLEHRYYGKSHPTPDLTVKNLRWLSSRQALADLAAFVSQMRGEAGLVGPWVALGGSYPGSLAAWFRLKYPHLVAGAVSTSGPLLAKADFFEYLEVVEASLDTVPGCSAVIKGRFHGIESAIQKVKQLTAHRMGWKFLSKHFKLCSSLDGGNKYDVTNLFESLIGNFEGIVQYNKDNRAFEGAEWQNITIDTVCNIMTDPNLGSDLQRLAEVNDLSLKMSGAKCLDHTYSSQINVLQETSWEAEGAAGGRQWTYQTCTEFGWYQSSDIPQSSWGDIIPVQFFEKMCTDVYGPKFSLDLLEEGIKASNAEYGGLDIEVSNVVFVHGSIDPWHAMGIISSSSKSAPALYIEGTAHCANMYPEAPDDPVQLKTARRRIGQLVHQWIAGTSEQRTFI